MLWHYALVPCNNIKKYLTECKKLLTHKKYKILLNKTNQVSSLDKIFSVKNIGVHKKISILGIKFKIKSKRLVEREKINQIISNQQRQIDLLYQILDEQKKSDIENQNNNDGLHLVI